MIVMDVARSGARSFWDPVAVNRKDTDGTITQDGNTSRSLPRLTFPVMIGGGTSVSPTRTGIKEFSSPRETIGPVEVRNAQPFDTSINGNSFKKWDPTQSFSKVIGHELCNNSSTDIYLRCSVKFTCDTVLP